MNEIVEKEVNIEDMIYEIRGVHVMLSSDVAKLYQVETKRINEVIKRNLNRFPERFCFQLNSEEMDKISSRSQIATLNKSNNLRGYNIKYLPYVLTEQGIMMLSGLLKSDIAVRVNIQIIDAFVKMKRYFANSISNNEMLVNHEKRILKIEEILDKLSEKQNLNSIIYEGKIYDAYSVLIDILNEAEHSIIIIDNYANKELFDILKNIDKDIVVISKNLDQVLIKKYNSQYSNIRFINNNDFHDRYIILDNKTVYNSGMSLKDIGKKYSFIYKVTEQFFIDDLLEMVREILLGDA